MAYGIVHHFPGGTKSSTTRYSRRASRRPFAGRPDLPCGRPVVRLTIVAIHDSKSWGSSDGILMPDQQDISGFTSPRNNDVHNLIR